jgi:hypothetical protein
MTDQVKYMGVILDNKLDWKAYFEKRMRKACIAYWQWRRAVERLRNYHRRCWPGYGNDVVRPILSYAFLVWWKGVELKNAQKRLSHLQRMTRLGIIGGMRSTPMSALCFRGDANVVLTFVHKTINKCKGGNINF